MTLFADQLPDEIQQPLDIDPRDAERLATLAKPVQGEDIVSIEFALPQHNRATDPTSFALAMLRRFLNVKGIQDVSRVMGCLGTEDCNLSVTGEHDNKKVCMKINKMALDMAKKPGHAAVVCR